MRIIDDRSQTDLDARLRKLRFRSWHRGTREMDLILGGFADTQLARLTPSELDQYEVLLEAADTDLLPWITGEREAPIHPQTEILPLILAYCRDKTV